MNVLPPKQESSVVARMLDYECGDPRLSPHSAVKLTVRPLTIHDLLDSLLHRGVVKLKGERDPCMVPCGKDRENIIIVSLLHIRKITITIFILSRRVLQNRPSPQE